MKYEARSGAAAPPACFACACVSAVAAARGDAGARVPVAAAG